MHLLRTESYSLDDNVEAIDLAQSPADIVFLSFTNSDLSALAAAYNTMQGARPSLRLANLAQLKHPYSIDLYVERTCAGARFVLVRLLGGLEYWRYGAEQLARAAREYGFHLAVIPGDMNFDERLADVSSLDPRALREVWSYFLQGGAQNMAQLLTWIHRNLGADFAALPAIEVPAFGRFEQACHGGDATAAQALLVFYRSVLMASDVAPILALSDALHARGMKVECVFVTSLKDQRVSTELAALIAKIKPDVILNTTAFSARVDDGPSILDGADAPVLQVILAGSNETQWQLSRRGLSASDLAMNVVLPEVDGRLISRAISFKAETQSHPDLQFTDIAHRPIASRITFVADQALRWARLRRTQPCDRAIACVLSDYPAKGGRAGYAVGLDTPASVTAIADLLREADYDIGALPATKDIMPALMGNDAHAGPSFAAYRTWFDALPESFRSSVLTRWGAPEEDPACRDGAFRFPLLRSGKLHIAVQPDRGTQQQRKGEYHDADLPPRHAYIAFYLWLRFDLCIDAMIHCGTHGTLEWLPGKAAALSEDCAPEILLGATPVIYPFIVNNPGEAAQAKRRLSAVIVGHLTPPLTDAESHGAASELESLLDEYANAELLDKRRARHLGEAILIRARETGLAQESGLAEDEDSIDALAKLDAWLCDLKDMRIRDGLHIFGQPPQSRAGEDIIASFGASGTRDKNQLATLLADSARNERHNLLAALNGRFVPPGPGGAPSRGRLDVLPTGRNLYSVDPRNIPTRAAWEIGQRTAAEIMQRYAQDHGDWPQRIVMDLWGSATMRTGGDEIAQVLALLGARPVWDHATARVLGFEILPPAKLERPRVDVTLRISGLFRDVFATQIALLDQAIHAVAGLDEEPSFNPLAAQAKRDGQTQVLRIFGAAPGTYGTDVSRIALGGDWAARDELGRAYLESTSHAFGGAEATAQTAAGAFRSRVGEADAFVHVQDTAEQDLLDSDVFAAHEGGFAAAAQSLGAQPELYHADTSSEGRAKVRLLREEIARVVRARATNPKWIAGQMRHGYRGASEMAEAVDNLFAYAALTDAVQSRHFDLVFDAYCDDDNVRAFLCDANPAAAKAIAQRLDEAQRRGFWLSRRNSVAPRLAEMQGGRA
ncbi:cobaltochelatase subunit CobN [Methylovirgula sp. 4M-Z18]|uniref:cobaltochelatase subunit CobN n=1 Tax=Methylovirgula sp. 4M-Z18 TaxID=2293567 RepID=UPI000E2ED775|nr:cobaltochelatase subunit CobN [Methylovirgula sp. 4M-Z18]RFB76299.1 cobaltochelatase subunit CobN [Methylovirgula sp. 4M-Z18]